MNVLRNIVVRLHSHDVVRNQNTVVFTHRKWSDLALAFNSIPERTTNKQATTSGNSGLFNVPELQSYEGFYLLKERCISHTNELIEEATNEHRTRKMVQIFDDLSDSLCRVADLAEFIRVAHPSDQYTQAAEIASASISGIVERLNTDAKLYLALRNVVKNGDTMKTTQMDDHVAHLFLLDFEQSGIHLSENERKKVVVLNDTILQLGQFFVNNSTSPRIVPKHLIPKSAKDNFTARGDNIIIGDLIPESPNPLVREITYRVYFSPDTQQENILTHLLSSRHELAQICGFSTYAQRALKGSTLETPSLVMQFLDNLSEGLQDRSRVDFRMMSLMKQKECHIDMPLAIWDTLYYTKKAKEELFYVQSTDYSPYFSVGTCMEGLNNLMKSLYGITFVITEMNSGESWAPLVYKLAVTHETEGLLGYIYCDFYKRNGKPNQDCHFTIRGGRLLPDGSYQLPIVVLLLNFPEPRWSTPTLLTPRLVDNLFHEMGHAMHSMLARTHYQHIAGTRCSTDFAEVPSVLMEYFANDIRVLKTFAKHFQTNQPMPEEMLHRLCASKHVFSANELQMQLFYAVVDQMYHGKHPLPGTTSEVLAKAQKKYYGLPYVENTSWQYRFSHIVGYGAKYYSYLVSKALASCIWQNYFEKDPFNRTEGEKYRRECLGYGGGKPPRQLVTDYMQQEPTNKLLVESILKDIDAKQRENQKYLSTS